MSRRQHRSSSWITMTREEREHRLTRVRREQARQVVSDMRRLSTFS